ncbi:MAG: hypothetical protein DWH91_04530 [Planctomycetota bacterium]|nr:MAG: hypothetical protein DWH91_04530 [Planctomycetota bacterium]
MGSGDNWKELFENWPEGMPRQGILITSFQETVPFMDFRISEGILLLQRERPDTLNARKMMVSYESISALKFTDVDDISIYGELGFR